MKFEYVNYSTQIFSGFYESELCPDDYLRDEAYACNLEYPYTFDIIAYKAYENEIAKENTEWIFWKVKDKGIIKSMEFKELDSPREYNYRTDRLVINMEFDEEKLTKYCFEDKRGSFEKYLRETYTSRSGFISFVNSNINEFENEVKDDLHYNVMVEFYLLEEVDFEEVFEEMMEVVHNAVYEYMGLYNEQTRKYYDYYFNDSTGEIVIEGERK